MSKIQSISFGPNPVKCRFEMTAVDTSSVYEFCVFEFPACEGCPNALRSMETMASSEDPMKAAVWQGWLALAFRPKN